MEKYFQIAKDGKSVKIAETSSTRALSQKKFDLIAKEITFEGFLSLFNEEEIKHLHEIICTIREINKNKFVLFHSKIQICQSNLNYDQKDNPYKFVNLPLQNTDAILTHMYDNGEYLREEDLLDYITKHDVADKTFTNFKDAYKYGVTCYGAEFMKKHKQLFQTYNTCYIFKNGEQVKNPSPEYIEKVRRALETQANLCKITNFKKILQKDPKKRTK